MPLNLPDATTLLKSSPSFLSLNEIAHSKMFLHPFGAGHKE
jgi:hypothetical protein